MSDERHSDLRSDGGQPSRDAALRLIEREGIIVACALAARLNLHPRTVQRWFHRDDFKDALSRHEQDQDCPVCNGTGKMPSLVYFCETREGNIKIGVAREYSHLRNYLRWNIKGQKLLAVEPGSFALERKLHRRFKNLRVAGKVETYTATPELLDYIAALSDMKGDPSGSKT